MEKILLNKIIKLTKNRKISQIFIVAVTTKTNAHILMYEKNSIGEWYNIINTYGYIGKNGLGKTKEGDGKTPIGIFKFNYAFGIENNPGCKIHYHKITNNDWWSGDQRENYYYNKLVNIKKYPNLNKNVSEHLIDYKYEYRYCLNINYNKNCEIGKGSAIFLHCINPNKHYTNGCVAIPCKDMLKVMKNVKKDCLIIIDFYKNIY